MPVAPLVRCASLCGGLVPAVYELMWDAGGARAAAVGAILDSFFADADYVELLEAIGLSEAGTAEAGDADDRPLSESPLEEAYRRLCDLADRYPARRGRGAG